MFALLCQHCLLLVQVYIHCSTAVCSAAPGRNCEPSCHRKGSKSYIFFSSAEFKSNMHLNLTMFVYLSVERAVKAEVQRPTEPKAVVSVGPVIMSTPEE